MNKLGEWSAVLALLMVTGSAATADGPIQIAAPQIEYKYVQPASPSLLGSLGKFASLNQKIDKLEETVEAKNNLIYITRVQKDLAVQEQIATYVTIDQAITDLYQYVGKTSYVLSGSTPQAWDCSGLTLWFYETYRGITLKHSATAQKNLGTEVDAPIPGDIVAFTHKNSKNAYHVGIYIGGGKMIHAINPNRDTVLEDISAFSESENSKVAYIRY
jgi:cell wall-associated NlpC family hydrolase